MAKRINTSERKSHFPRDDRLRACGWKIASRPDKGEAIWILQHRGRVLQTLTESKALAYVVAAREYEFAK